MKSLGHLDFWLGDLLVGIVPWMGQGVRAVDTPEYFGHLGQVLANLMIGDTLTTTSVKTLTNRIVYADMTSSFPPPKVVRESDRNYDIVWSRLHSPVVEARARDTLYLVLHNKLPVLERLFRIRLRNDPYCQVCEAAEVADLEHFFCNCSLVARIWSWVRARVLEYSACRQVVSDWDILNLFLPVSEFDKEVVWMISSYVLFIWDNIFVRNADVKLEQFFGFLTYKYKENQNFSSFKLKYMDGIS
jgi:hypothetical protein